MTSSAQQAQDRLITRRTPIWLLDIDGVLNACQLDPRPGYSRAVTGFGPVTYNPAVIRRIAELHRAGLVDLRWLTTWLDAANYLAREVGLPLDLPVEGKQHFRKPSAWWKADAAREVAEANPDRLIIWTDDDLDYSYGCGELDWVVGHATFLISPDPQVGLSDAAMTSVEYACRAAAALEPAGGVA